MSSPAQPLQPITEAPLDRIYRERVQTWSDIQGHLEFMHDLVVEEKAQRVLELGVRSGNSTAALLAAADKIDGHVWSVDVEHVIMPPEFHASGRHTLIIGDDLTMAYSPSMPAEVDICFIDTLHWFHHTLAELRLYGPKSRIVLLHDTELESPWQQPAGEPPFPVREAIKMYVDTDLATQPLEAGKKGPVRKSPESRWSVEWRPGSYGMAVLRRR